MAAPLSFQLLLDTVLSSVGRLSCKEQLNIGSVEYILMVSIENSYTCFYCYILLWRFFVLRAGVFFKWE